MPTPQFDISPEKEGSILAFLSRQWNFIPEPVENVSLVGKTALIVGATSGIGVEVARQCLELGVTKLIIGARNREKVKTVVENLGTASPEAVIQSWALDLSSYQSVTAFAKRAEGLERLDFVILNAGICLTKFNLNPNTGHEETVQTNYLSQALLAILLLPIAKSTRRAQENPTRFTFTSSDVASWTSFKEKDNVPLLPSLDKGSPDPTDRMMVSKLLGQFFVSELARRVPDSVAVINCATPGMVHDTDFNREVDLTFGGKIAKLVTRRLGYTSKVGARHITDAAVLHGKESHGQYLSTQKLKPMAPILYTEKGRKISSQLWAETMDEFSFAQAEEILRSLSE